MLDKITNDMKLAMKAKDKLRLSTIRMFRASLKDKEIELKIGLSDADVVAVAARLIKQRKDAANQYAEAGRQDLADKEIAELDVLAAYMPAPMGEQEIVLAITRAVAETNASGMKDMGKVMAILKPLLQGKADMGMVSTHVKSLLSKQ